MITGLTILNSSINDQLDIPDRAVSTGTVRGFRETLQAVSGGSSGETGGPSSLGGGFVATSDPKAPHLVRYADVPDSLKYPLGPYKQAPPEFGGDWWQVNPFTGSEPWLRLNVARSIESLPEGFVELFGPRPRARDFETNLEFRVARTRWEQDLKYFKGVGVPEGIDPAELEQANQTFQEWGLGRAVFFKGRYGWQVRFPDSAIPTHGGTSETALRVPHLLVAKYQIKMIQTGSIPSQVHPWVPAHLLSSEAATGLT